MFDTSGPLGMPRWTWGALPGIASLAAGVVVTGTVGVPDALAALVAITWALAGGGLALVQRRIDWRRVRPLATTGLVGGLFGVGVATAVVLRGAVGDGIATGVGLLVVGVVGVAYALGLSSGLTYSGSEAGGRTSARD